MKKCKSRVMKIACMISSCVWILLASSLPVFAGSGSVTIKLKELQSEGSIREGVEFSLYQVGEVSETGAPFFYDRYQIKKFPVKAEETAAAAAILIKGLEEEMFERKQTDARGILTFEDLERGVYLIMANEDNSYGKITPVILYQPSYELVNGVQTGPNERITVVPKAEPYPDETDKPIETETNTETENRSNKNTGSSKSSKQVKTEDSTPIASYLCLAAVSILLMAGSIYKKRGKEG